MKLKVEVKNMGEPAFLTRAILTIPRVTPIVEIPSICHDLPNEDTIKTYTLICEIGYPLEKNVIFLVTTFIMAKEFQNIILIWRLLNNHYHKMLLEHIP